jgi:transcriptional enhancer factor
LIDFSAYIEQQRLDQPDAYQKHLFVHLGPERTLEDPAIEAIDIRQIYDKFPEKKGGLKELYEKGPPHLFFLVKFWVRYKSSPTTVLFLQNYCNEPPRSPIYLHLAKPRYIAHP